MLQRPTLLAVALTTTFVVGLAACGEDDASVAGDPWATPAGCGDGVAAGDEACDGEALAGKTCASFGYRAGTLGCNATCTGFDVQQCEGVPPWSGTSRSQCFECADDQLCVDGECVAACEAQALPDVLELDVETVTVAGRATNLPEAEPEASWPRGRVVFFSRSTKTVVDASAGELGPDGAFQVELYPDTYDVYWQPATLAAHPAVPAIVAREVQVDAARTLELALPDLVRLDIEVEPPAETDPADLAFRVHLTPTSAPEVPWAARWLRGAVAEIGLGAPPTARFTVPVGVYDARLESVHLGEQLPWFDRPLFGGRDLTEDTRVTHAIGLHTLSGTIAMAEGLPDEGTSFSVSVEGEGELRLSENAFADDDRFSLALPSGRYTVTARISAAGPSGVPGFEAVRSVELTEDAAVELTVGDGLTALRGRVFGAPTGHLPLIFEQEASEVRRTVFARDGRFTAALPVGRYQVYSSSERATTDGPAGTFQLGTIDVGTTAVDGMIFELPTAPTAHLVRGEITRNGEPMADDPAGRPRAFLFFRCADGANCGPAVHTELPATGPARYEVELAPGTYRVLLQTAGQGLEDRVGEVLPRGHYVLDPRFEVHRETTRRDFEVRVATVSGAVTAGGGLLPPGGAFPADEDFGSEARGAVAANVAYYRGTTVSHSWEPATALLQAEGPADYALEVFPGFYGLAVFLRGFEMARHNTEPGLVRYASLVDAQTRLDRDLPLRHKRARLTHNGEPWPAAGGAFLEARTVGGTFRAPVPDDGTLDLFWIGADPAIWLVNERSSDLPRGAVILRSGCD